MILTDREIKKMLADKRIVISPPPALDAYDSTSVDLTLDPILRTFRSTAGIVIDPGAAGYKAKELIEKVTDPITIPKDGWDLAPGPLVLGWTRERIELNIEGQVAARVEGKSGLARLGLAVHVTAPTIHAGFIGTIQLEIVNHGPMPIRLRPGLAICQLIIEMTKGKPGKAYKGQFSGQKAV